MPIVFEVMILALLAYTAGFVLVWALWRAGLRRKRR